MAACTPAPPPLTAVVREATALTTARVAPIGVPQACLSPEVPAGSGMSNPGTVWFSSADAALFAQPPSRWSADRHVAVLHEVLHQVGMARGLEEGGEMDVEEGVVEAVSQDLRPQWLRRWIGRDVVVPVAYPAQVAAVRRGSAAATGAGWKSAPARAWRVALLATPPATRHL